MCSNELIIWNNEQILTHFFEPEIKKRQAQNAVGRAFGYKAGLESFRIHNQVPCRYIPEAGKIMRNLLTVIRDVKVLLRIVRQDSWHYIEVKYGHKKMQMFLKMDPQATPAWLLAWKDQVLKNLGYDHGGKLSDAEFTKMAVADSLANCYGLKTSAKDVIENSIGSWFVMDHAVEVYGLDSLRREEFAFILGRIDRFPVLRDMMSRPRRPVTKKMRYTIEFQVLGKIKYILDGNTLADRQHYYPPQWWLSITQ